MDEWVQQKYVLKYQEVVNRITGLLQGKVSHDQVQAACMLGHTCGLGAVKNPPVARYLVELGPKVSERLLEP